ncbi:MAG: undecaprenyl-diphosphate phosphatase [Puniceicoccales bacterium]|jgi:undecaprenyl-diphosphatase|nr:undecaprenyl-diphosphate phosphatase [Puniceicoccales bacterium]
MAFSPKKMFLDTHCRPTLSIGQAIILGIIQGITEYLPVSSGAHLLLMEKWMVPGACQLTFDAFNGFLQLGSVWVILLFYRRRIGRICAGLVGRSPEGLRLFFNLLCAFIPTALTGHFFGSGIRACCENLKFIASTLAIGGIYIFALVHFCHARRQLIALSWKQSFFIGVLQGIALFPGVSRSLMTISAGLWVGLPMAEAVEFSFLLGAGTIGAAITHQFFFKGISLEAGLHSIIGWGIISASIASVVAIRLFIKRFSMGLLFAFACYRIALAFFIFGWHPAVDA